MIRTILRISFNYTLGLNLILKNVTLLIIYKKSSDFIAKGFSRSNWGPDIPKIELNFDLNTLNFFPAGGGAPNHPIGLGAPCSTRRLCLIPRAYEELRGCALGSAIAPVPNRYWENVFPKMRFYP